MLPSGGSWPCDGEIDIMEQWGNDENTNLSTGAAHVGFALRTRRSCYSSFKSQLTKDHMQINFMFMKLDGMKILFNGI